METIMNKANKDIQNLETYFNGLFEMNYNRNTDIYLNTFKEKFEELFIMYKKLIFLKGVSFRPTMKYKHKIKQIYLYKKVERTGTIIIYKKDVSPYKSYDEYEGQWENGLRHGQGKQYYNGKLDYEGQFKNDMYHGEGKLYDYFGSLIKGKYYSNRKITYKGQFEKDMKHGEGKLYDYFGSLRYDGEWENNLKHGEGKQ